MAIKYETNRGENARAEQHKTTDLKLKSYAVFQVSVRKSERK